MSVKELLRFLVLACLFVTPFVALIVPSSMFFPFITGKNFTFRILVEIALGAWILLMFIDAAYRPRFSWIAAAAGTFLGIIALADFLGVNPYRSFWSNYERMEGLITHIHLFLFFIIAGSVFVTEKMWKWFWRTSLVVSLFIATNAYQQLHGIVAVHQSSNRLDATLGNSTYLAIYALFHAFLAMFLFFREKEDARVWRWVYPVIAVVNVVVLYYTQTRGAALGLVGGIFLAFILAALFDRERPERRKYAIGGVVAIALMIGSFIYFKDARWIQENRTLGRIADISLSDATTQSRFIIWHMSWEGFKERPILGWGQDNFLYVFGKHYDPRMWNQEPWFDRSHDVFFDWLIAGGALGLLAYLSLFVAALYYIWFGRKAHMSAVEKGILTGMLAGYFVHNIFVFDNLTSYLIFFGVLAHLHTLNAETKEAVHEPGAKKVKHREEAIEAGDLAIITAIVVAVTVGAVYLLNIRNIKANLALIDSIRPETVLTTGANGQKEITVKKVLDLRLFGTGEAREQLLQLALQAGDPRVPADLRQQFYNLATSELDMALAEDPENLRLISFAAAFYQRFGQFDRAEGYYKTSIEKSPRHQGAYLDLSQLYTAQGKYAEAEQIAKTAYELEKGYPEAVVAYAATLIYQRKTEEFERVLQPWEGIGSVMFDNRLISAFGMAQYYDRVIALENEKIAQGLASGRDYFALAAGHAGVGNTAQAVEAIKKAMEVDGNLKEQGEQMIKQLLGGQ